MNNKFEKSYWKFIKLSADLLSKQIKALDIVLKSGEI